MKDYFLFYVYRVFGKSYDEVSDPAFSLTLMIYFLPLTIIILIMLALIRGYSIIAFLIYTFLIFRYVPRKIKPVFVEQLPRLKKKFQNRSKKEDLSGKLFIWIVVLIDLLIFFFSWFLSPLILTFISKLLPY